MNRNVFSVGFTNLVGIIWPPFTRVRFTKHLSDFRNASMDSTMPTSITTYSLSDTRAFPVVITSVLDGRDIVSDAMIPKHLILSCDTCMILIVKSKAIISQAYNSSICLQEPHSWYSYRHLYNHHCMSERIFFPNLNYSNVFP